MSRLLPDWLDAYLVYTAESRSPNEYHTWVAMTTIAGALRRKVFYDHGYFNLYPNLYVILVGPPGRCKKTTAMAIGRRFLFEVPGISFATDSSSREQLILDISQSISDGHSSMTAYSSEFSSMLTTSGADMVVFLTDVYDCPPEWTHKTKGGGTNKLVAPYLNIVGGMTPDSVAKSISMDTIGTGLTARIIFVYQDTPRVRDVFAELSQDQKDLRDILVKDLAQISLISGQYQWSDEAKKFYREWELKNQEDRTVHDPRLAGYFERKPQHLIKATMICAASQRDELVMTLPDLHRGLALLGHLEPMMGRTFSGVGKNPLTLDLYNVSDLIKHEPGIGYKRLFSMFKHSVRKDEFDEVVDTLASIGYIKVSQEEDGPHYYPNLSMEDDFR